MTRPQESVPVERARVYHVWDAPTRWFHWINVLCAVLLLLSGLLFRYRTALHIDSAETKAGLQALHVLIGYAFVANLLVRVAWGFLGNRHARWRAVLPDRRSLRELGPELRALIARRPVPYIGRAPLGRVSVTLMFILLLLQAGSGLIRAGTDLYYPPLGRLLASYMVPAGVDPATVSWRNGKALAVPERYAEVAALKRVAGQAHTYGWYLLLGMMVLHIGGVTLSEVRQNSGLVSAMFSGRKLLAGTPLDAEVDGGRPR